MTTLSIQTLGELSIERAGAPVELPPSRRTRALLAYLLITGRSHRREHLCELLWWMPDDPRGALRWSLSKIRSLLNDPSHEYLSADRERVTMDTRGMEIDLRQIRAVLDQGDSAVSALDQLVTALEQPFLDGVDIDDQPQFQEWLNAEREAVRRLRLQALRQLALHPELPPQRVLESARTWANEEPFSRAAATHWLATLQRFGETAEASRCAAEYADRFRKAGVAWVPPADGSQPAPPVASARQLQARQKIQFCMAEDSVRIAYATVGEGPPIVKAANWLSHLELDWDAPIWSPLFRRLAKGHRLIRYDERGNGLSDWDVDDLSLEAFVNDLETVVDATKLDQFALLGISQGAAVSIEYAIRHPERVSKLILFGGYPAGWRIGATAESIREREAVMTLVASGWGQDNPAYRQIFSSTFMPTATADELQWFNEFQRATTSPANAVRFLSAFGDIDVRHQLAQLKVPTLVIHSRGDQRIPLQTGLDMAATIPNAEFVGLESDNHLLLGRESASIEFVNAIREFLREG